jgi:light-regulated signal transduction histidine kinase (bacteriophytochrome)
MGTFHQNEMAEEVQRLRQALDAETRRCLDLRRRTEHLDVEFEEFVSLAAHNLRESLRNVASYSQLLAETLSGRLDSDSGVYLGHIQEAAARMQSLLADVVDYWSLVAGDQQPSRTDMEAVLRQALLLADKQIADRGADVTHDSLPAVMGDSEMLTKVLHHLIRNAIEYCDGPSPRVRISSRRENDELVFSVQDNGPGVDPAFHSRMFRAFKRLHGNEYPGNGLGLAFCRKAIEWHHGRIWVESEPGAGSTLHFTLPPAD